MPQDPLNLLCIEPRFPGRLGGVADWLVRRRGYRCHFFCQLGGSQGSSWPESDGTVGSKSSPSSVGGVAREHSVAWQRLLERSLCYAFGASRKSSANRQPRPIDIVLGTVGRIGLFALRARDALPKNAGRSDCSTITTTPVGMISPTMPLPETPPAYYHWRRAANAIDLLDLENGVMPWALDRVAARAISA